MTQLPFSRIRNLVLSAAVLLIAGGIGYQMGAHSVSLGVSGDHRVVVNTAPPAGNTVDFSLFWDVWDKLTKNYVDQKSINVQKLVYGAITGMVSAVGDPFTSFFPPQENQQFKQDLGGAFEGIGAQLGMKDGRVIIVSPLRGQPAEAAGLKPNDIILKVDGADTTGWTVEQAVTKIRGPKGTKVTLTVLHTQSADKPVDISIVRATITVPSVVWWVKSPNAVTEISGATGSASIHATARIGYISLSRFGDNTNAEWDKAVSDLLADEQVNGKIRGLVFDLRNNPGGYLEGAIYIASEFLRSGTVVSQVNSDGSRQDYPVERRGKLLDVPMVVLVNKGSASAAEIVSGALHDKQRAKLVGETTFGKGTVQTPFDLSGGAAVHITTGKWLLPSGNSISQKGITPDYVVALPDSPTPTQDTQLAKAIDLLLQ